MTPITASSSIHRPDLTSASAISITNRCHALAATQCSPTIASGGDKTTVTVVSTKRHGEHERHRLRADRTEVNFVAHPKNLHASAARVTFSD